MSNVYAAPSASFSNSDVAATTRMFAINGRIGRVRWIGYSSALWILCTIAVVILIQLVALVSKDVATTFGKLLSLVIWIIPALVARRRLHDLGLSALYLIGVVIPFINLYFIFILLFKRGDEGNNEFGPEPAPNDRAVYWLAVIIPLVSAIGILAAIAIPAYQDYTKRARAKASSVSLETPRVGTGAAATTLWAS